ncbi:hypothetical protein [Nonomuraea zeae]|uniref:Uncharacterized protein n=1 Tax=Nonomuraea zeae TaxID=1642303 RepID=A0A5S4FJI4_9ACTN|nr:hypothetical protein [Nonomuraea zeae]TMR20654.1 hypothetical protein ETD85_52005 [Nonomuraea zeae]
MHRIMSLVFALLVALGVTAAATTPAAAATSPALFCQVIGNTTGSGGGAGQGWCGTRFADSSYVLDFGVANGFNFYNWTVPSKYQKVAGCNVSTPFCDIVVKAKAADQSVTVTVTTDDVTATAVTVSATAEIPAVCGKFLC